MTSTLVTREHLMQISFLGPFVTHFEFLANKVEKRRYYCIFVTGWNVFSKVVETYPLNQPEEKRKQLGQVSSGVVGVGAGVGVTVRSKCPRTKRPTFMRGQLMPEAQKCTFERGRPLHHTVLPSIWFKSRHDSIHLGVLFQGVHSQWDLGVHAL